MHTDKTTHRFSRRPAPWRKGRRFRLSEGPRPDGIALVPALRLAHEFAAETEADADEREEIVLAALAAGNWLASEGRPGRWDTLDVGAMLPTLDLQDDREQQGLLLTLAGLIGFAALRGHMPVKTACRCLYQIDDLADDGVDATVGIFARRTAKELRRLEGDER